MLIWSTFVSMVRYLSRQSLVLITIIHAFEIDMELFSIFMWNAFQNVSLELVGINAQTLFFKCSINQKQVSPFCSLTGADVFAVTETWFSEFDDAHRANCGSRKLKFSLFRGFLILLNIRSQQALC